MRERRRPAIIRFRRYNMHSDPSNWYIGQSSCCTIRGTTKKLTCLLDTPAMLSITTLYEQLLRPSIYTWKRGRFDVDEDSRPEHAWCQIAPSTEYSNTNTAQQGSETITDISQDYLVDNDRLLQSNPTMQWKRTYIKRYMYRFESAANHKAIPPAEYRNLMRSLNTISKNKLLCTIVIGVKELW